MTSPPGVTPPPQPPTQSALPTRARTGWSCFGLTLLGVVFIVAAAWITIQVTAYRMRQKVYTELGMPDDAIREMNTWLAQPAGFPDETWQQPLETSEEFWQLHKDYFASAGRLTRRLNETHTTAPVTLAEMEAFTDATEALAAREDYTLVPYRANHYPISPDLWYGARTALLGHATLVAGSTNDTATIKAADLRALRLQLALLKTAPEDSKPHKIEEILPHGVWALAVRYHHDAEALQAILALLHQHRDTALISQLSCKPFNVPITRFMLHDDYIGRPPVTHGDHARQRLAVPLYNNWILDRAPATHPLVITKRYPASISSRLSRDEANSARALSKYDVPPLRKTVHDLLAAYHTEELTYYHSAEQHNQSIARFYTRNYDFLMIALAQRIMHLRGAPPATSLQSMSPAYLPTILHDPHSPPGTPYRYNPDRHTFASHQDGGHVVHITDIFTWPADTQSTGTATR